MSTTEATCQRCDSPLPPETPGGICPACLMGAAAGNLDSLPDTVPTDLPDVSAGAGHVEALSASLLGGRKDESGVLRLLTHSEIEAAKAAGEGPIE